MRRRVTREETERLLDRLRERIPGLVLRTTLIAGFPGESQQQFETLLEFVRRRRFERLGAFAYSEEPGTPAAELDAPVSDRVKASRRDAILAAQQEIAFAWSEAQVGRTVDVLIDRAAGDQPDVCLGRTWADAPEIDGAVYVTGRGVRPGQIVPCEIVAARGYDLVGVPAAAQRDDDAQQPSTNRSPLLKRLLNLPNQLTSLRLLLSVVLFCLIAWEQWICRPSCSLSSPREPIGSTATTPGNTAR